MKKRRKLRKRVYVVFIIFLCALIFAGVYIVRQRSTKDYSFFQGSVEEVELSMKSDGFLYTYKQQYFNNEEVIYLSLNDIYNVYTHLSNGQMTLDQAKDKMEFKNETIEATLDYKKEVFFFTNCQWSVASLQYLTTHNGLEKFDLKTVNHHAYIYEGEVFIPKELVELILFNSSYQVDLENKTIQVI